MKNWRVGRWSVARPDGMEVIENEDSLQFSDDHRVIYLSAMAVSGKRGGLDSTATELHAAFGRVSAHDHELSGPDAFGYAKVEETDDGSLQIKATRESDGSVLTCVFSLSTREDVDWALSIWRDIEPAQHE